MQPSPKPDLEKQSVGEQRIAANATNYEKLSQSMAIIYGAYLIAFPVFITINGGNGMEYISSHVIIYLGVAIMMSLVLKEKRWAISIVGLISGYKVIIGSLNPPYQLIEFNFLHIVVHILIGVIAGAYIWGKYRQGLHPFGDFNLQPSKSTSSNQSE